MLKMHIHKPQWHTVGLHVEHLIHDARFWAVLAMVLLSGLIILMIALGGTGTNMGSRPAPFPMYPYIP